MPVTLDDIWNLIFYGFAFFAFVAGFARGSAR